MRLAIYGTVSHISIPDQAVHCPFPKKFLPLHIKHHARGDRQKQQRPGSIAPITAAAAQNTSKAKKKPNLLTRILSITSAPYTSYIPDPPTFLHFISAETKQLWVIAVLLLMARASSTMRLTIVGIVAALTIAALPYRLWKPQLVRMTWLCAIIFLFTACGTDAVPPVMSDRSVSAVLQSSTTGTGTMGTPPLLTLTSMHTVLKSTYRYVVVALGPLTITKRSLSLAITLSGITFVSLQCASLCLITTSPERMALAVERALTPFGLLGLPVKELVLTVLLSLRFMATVFEEARNLCLGLASRGIDWGSLGGRGTLGLTVNTLGRLFGNLLARSENIATAMAARGFRGPEEHMLFLDGSGSGGGGSGSGKGVAVPVANVLAVVSLIGLIALSRVLV